MNGIVCHYTFTLLLRRDALAIFNNVYAYIHLDKASPSLWKSAARELQQASSVLPLCFCDLELEWSPTATATDSSDSGFGVCERLAGVDPVSELGRVSERWRYGVEGACHARAHAFRLLQQSKTSDPRADNEKHDSTHNFTACFDPAIVQEEAHRAYKTFKEVPADMLDPRAWHVIFSGHWLHSENIIRTEGRAYLLGLRHKLRSVCHLFKRHLTLVDNLGRALALCKGRGSSHLTNSTCRQSFALNFCQRQPQLH